MSAASTARRKAPNACRLQEFYAHSEAINCVHIGRKTSSCYATGADDNVVKVWRLGKTAPIMTLEPHAREVDSVMFDQEELTLAAGTRSGTVKVWDLQTQKAIRTLLGHRASVRCMNFHPYGNFLATGSEDANLKIYDIRQKNCMQTYRGHNATVTSVCHSPDGRWIVSGDMTGVVKVWDLTGGKLLHELRLNSRTPVMGIDFHPHDYIMCVGGADAQISFWDMEAFAPLGTTPKESSTMRSVAFSKDGRVALSATGDALKTWAWEPQIGMRDAIDVGWGPSGLGGGGAGAAGGPAQGQQILGDMAEGLVPGHELIGVTRCKTVLAVFIVDISVMKPFDVPMEDSESGAFDPADSLLHTMERVTLSDAPAQPAASAGAAVASSPVAQPRTTILSHPSPAFFEAHQNDSDVAVPSRPNPFQQAAQQQAPRPYQPAQNPQPFVPTQPSVRTVAQPAPESHISKAAAPVASAKPTHDLPHRTAPPQTAPAASSSFEARTHQAPAAELSVAPPAAAAASAASTAAAGPSAAASAAAASAQAYATIQAQRQRVSVDHPTIVKVLQNRVDALRKLSVLWQSSGGSLGGAKRCIESLLAQDDLSVAVDFLGMVEPVIAKGSVLTLDMARDLLPLLSKLLHHKYENYVSCGLRYVRLLLIQFTPVILQCRASHASAGTGVDLTRDERTQRANDCFNHMQNIYNTCIAACAKRPGALGEIAKETRQLLEKLLWTKA